MASVIAYVDGFNLYHGLRAKYGHRYLWLDLVELVRRLRPRDHIVAVRYYTALVLNDPAALDRQQMYLNALAAHNGRQLEIVRGRYQSKSVFCRRCGSGWTMYEEKETDVNIAVSLVADAAARASDIALLISADSDLCPAIRIARSVNKGRGLIAAFPPKRSSFEIRSLIPGAFTLAAADIRNSQLPNAVPDRVTGGSHRRPEKWA